MPNTTYLGASAAEDVALRLLEIIAALECRSLSADYQSPSGWRPADRKWLLDSYSDCLFAVQGQRRTSGQHSRVKTAQKIGWTENFS
ncbi:MAG: hypothetical protein WCI56_13690 [Hyphomicrobiales bacterium]